MKTLLTYILCAVAIFSFAVTIEAPFAYATGKAYVPLAPIDVEGSEFTSTDQCVFDSDPNTPSCLGRYLRTIYNIGIAMAGLFAVFSIVRGGFTLLFTDSILGHSEAKGIILRALGGLVIVYSSYIFMNQISPSLGRELDLSLDFKRITIQEDKGTLAVIDNLSQYQLDLLREARVRNEEWRNGEVTRIQGEIASLERQRDTETDPEEKGLIQGRINQKVADLTTLEREGVVKNVEHDASIAFQEATTNTQVNDLIKKVTEGTGDGSIASVHAAFDKMIADTKTLTPEQIALIRINEAARIASINKNLILGLLEHPPTLNVTNPVTGVSRSIPDATKLDPQVAALLVSIEEERTASLQKLTTLQNSVSDSALKTKIINMDRVIWDQSCSTIVQIRNQCRFKQLSCENIPTSTKNACKANSTIEL